MRSSMVAINGFAVTSNHFVPCGVTMLIGTTGRMLVVRSRVPKAYMRLEFVMKLGMIYI